MPKLPVVSGSEVIRALQRLGFIVIRQCQCYLRFSKATFRVIINIYYETIT